MLENPLRSLQLLVTPFEKVRVGAASFANWLFLPLLSPLVLIAVPSFLERFWSSSPTFWSFHYQYSMLPAPILTFAAIDTCARMRSWWRGRLGGAASIALPVGALAASALLSFGAVFLVVFSRLLPPGPGRLLALAAVPPAAAAAGIVAAVLVYGTRRLARWTPADG